MGRLLYSNSEQFKSEINSFNDSFQTKDESDPYNLWIIFIIEIDRLSDLSIPSKITRSRCDLPWISSSIRKKIHKRVKLYLKVKKCKGKQNYDKMKSKLSKFKSSIQKEIRKSYWEYLESVIFNYDADNSKNKKICTAISNTKALKTLAFHL